MFHNRVLVWLRDLLMVPRMLLEDLVVDLERPSVVREFLAWQEQVALDRLCLAEDPQALVRWQSKVDAFRRARATLDGIMEALVSEGDVDG